MQTLFANAAIVDSTLPEPRFGNILIEDGIIREIGPRITSSAECQVIDVKGRAMMPGLIDCHVHVVASMMNLAENAQLPAPLALFRTARIMAGMLQRGFTTVRDVGGASFALAEAVAQGLTPGPRLIVCGKALSKTGGHSDARSRYDTYDANRWADNVGALGRIADGPDEVRRACRRELRSGASFIKVMANGGVASPTDPVNWLGYTVEELKVAVEEARDAKPMSRRISILPKPSSVPLTAAYTHSSTATSLTRMPHRRPHKQAPSRYPRSSLTKHWPKMALLLDCRQPLSPRSMRYAKPALRVSPSSAMPVSPSPSALTCSAKPMFAKTKSSPSAPASFLRRRYSPVPPRPPRASSTWKAGSESFNPAPSLTCSSSTVLRSTTSPCSPTPTNTSAW